MSAQENGTTCVPTASLSVWHIELVGKHPSERCCDYNVEIRVCLFGKGHFHMFALFDHVIKEPTVDSVRALGIE